MKLVKNTLTLTLCAAFTLPAMAGNIDIYGKANLSLESSDKGEGSFSEIKNNASRLGFKGKQKLDDALEVIFKLEYGVGIDGTEKNGQSIWSRNQYVGLKGSFGEVLVGKNDTVLKQSQGKVDLFNDLNGDIKYLFKGENRVSNTVTYKTPKINGFQFGATYVAADSVEAASAYSLAVFYGDKKLKKSKVYASIATDSNLKGYDVTRATIQGKVSGFVVGGMLQTQKSQTTGDKMNGALISAKYKMGKTTFKSQYQIANHDGGVTNYGTSVGADYKLAKNTKLYTFYTNLDLDTNANQDYLAVGMEYKF